jgi:hypothetical protein
VKGALGWTLPGGAGWGDWRRRILLVAGLGAVVLSGLWFGCSDKVPSEPQDSQTTVLTAFYQSPENFLEGIIEIDGERIDREWGSEFTPERGFTQVRLSAEDGAGDPGTTRYASMKAVYTDTDLYLLVEWIDPQPDQIKDTFVYLGPDLTAPMIRCVNVGGRIVCDSLYRRGPEDSLLTRNWWTQYGEDDKLAIAFEIEETSGSGSTFAEIGCHVACHGDGTQDFGPLTSGRLDLWYWLAGRTNPLRFIFDPNDPDRDEPAQGIPGYLDDLYVDAQGGILPDEGTPGYWPNFDVGVGVPRQVYRRSDDPLFEPPNPAQCQNEWGGECRPNNGVALLYLWREKYDAFYAPFGARDTLNQAIQPDPRKWQFGDLVPGYVLTYPTGSRADVRGKAKFNEDNSVWTLEIGRKLNTNRTTHDDVEFDPEAGKPYYFTVAIFDASTSTHWGSGPQMLVFGPKNGR